MKGVLSCGSVLEGAGRGCFVREFVDYPSGGVDTDDEGALSRMKTGTNTDPKKTVEPADWSEWSKYQCLAQDPYVPE